MDRLDEFNDDSGDPPGAERDKDPVALLDRRAVGATEVIGNAIGHLRADSQCL